MRAPPQHPLCFEVITEATDIFGDPTARRPWFDRLHMGHPILFRHRTTATARFVAFKEG